MNIFNLKFSLIPLPSDYTIERGAVFSLQSYFNANIYFTYTVVIHIVYEN